MPDTSSKKSILVIDDEKAITLLISTILKKAYDIEIAHDSHEAIIRIHNNQPDLVTLDISMPGLEGNELLPVIRAWKPNIPVLVISGRKENEIQRECIEKGATGFLPKPFEIQDLLNKVQSSINAEISSPHFPSDILSEVELAIAILERKGLITNEQTIEEIEQVKSNFTK